MLPTAYPIQPEMLEQCWRSYVETGQMPAVAGFTPDPAIVQSWERCRSRLDPRARPYLTRSKEQALETTLRTHADLLTVAVPHLEDIHQFIEGSEFPTPTPPPTCATTSPILSPSPAAAPTTSSKPKAAKTSTSSTKTALPNSGVKTLPG